MTPLDQWTSDMQSLKAIAQKEQYRMNHPSEIGGQRTYPASTARQPILTDYENTATDPSMPTPNNSIQIRLQQHEGVLDTWGDILDHVSGQLPNEDLPNGDGVFNVLLRIERKSTVLQRRLVDLVAYTGRLFDAEKIEPRR